MTGFSSSIIEQLRALLIDREEFSGHRVLQTFLKEHQLTPWINGLPEANTLIARVTTVIDYLGSRYDREDRNALVLFLNALAQSEQDAEKARALAELAGGVDCAATQNLLEMQTREMAQYNALERAGKALSEFQLQRRQDLQTSVEALQEKLASSDFAPITR